MINFNKTFGYDKDPYINRLHEENRECLYSIILCFIFVGVLLMSIVSML